MNYSIVILNWKSWLLLDYMSIVAKILTFLVQKSFNMESQGSKLVCTRNIVKGGWLKSCMATEMVNDLSHQFLQFT